MKKYADYENLAKLWERNGTWSKYYARCREVIDGRYDFEVIANALAGEFNNYVEGISNGDCLMNEYEIEEDGADPCFGICCGNVLRMNPSGKFYMPWACSNVSAKEALMDEIYWEALEDALEEHDMFSQPGEGDPLDVFFCKCFG